ELFANSAVIGKIQADIVKTSELDATKITTGTLDAGKLSVVNLSAASIISGTLKSINIEGVNISGSTFKSADNTTTMDITGGNVRLQQGGGNYSHLNPDGVFGYNSNGSLRFQ